VPDPQSPMPLAKDAADSSLNAETEGYRPRDEDDKIDVRAFLAPAQGEGELGRLAQYRVLKELGHGGMGMVLLAEDSQLLRLAALKIMLSEYARNKQARERFLREARAAAKIKHDNVVTIFQVGDENGIPFIAMEFLKGTPLDHYLKDKGELAIGQAVRIGHEIAEGLQAAHAEGLIHRDVKPANIWLEAPKGRVKILDFGLARAERDDAHVTNSGAVVGTPAFMSPEQASAKPLDPRSDLFSLGVVLYRLCTGQPPFSGPNTMAVLTALAVETPKPVRQLNPNVPAALEKLIHRLLAKDRDQRPASAEEVAVALAKIANPAGSGKPVIVKETVYVEVATAVEASPFADIDATPSVEEPARRSPTRLDPPRPSRKPLWGLGLAVGVVALGLGVYFLVGGTKKDPSAAPNKDAAATVNVPPERPKNIVKWGSPKADPDRKAVELLHPHTDHLWARLADGREVQIKKSDPIPDAPFVVTRISFEGERVEIGGFQYNVMLPAVLPLGSLRQLFFPTSDGVARENKAFPLNRDDLARLASAPFAPQLYRFGANFELEPHTIESLKRFPQLFQLACMATNATDDDFARLRELPALRMLSLRSARNSGAISQKSCKSLAALPLIFLECFLPGIDTEVLQVFAAMPDLTYFALARPTTDDLMAAIAKFPRLETLVLYGKPKFTDVALARLSEMKTLRTLDLQGANGTPAGAQKLSDALPKCRIVIAGGVVFGPKDKSVAPPADVEIEPKAKAKTDPDRLAVDLLHPQIDGIWVRTADGRKLQIKKRDAIPKESFVVVGVQTYDSTFKLPPGFDNAALLEAVRKLGSLQSLALGTNQTALTEAEVSQLAAAPFAPQLTNLDAGFELTAKTVELLKQFPQLTSLACRANQTEDADLAKLKEFPIARLHFTGLGTSGRVGPKGCQSLAALPLSQLTLHLARRLNAASFQSFAAAPGLRNLGVFNVEAIDEFLPEIAKLPALEFLNLYNNAKLTDQGLTHLARMKSLRQLDLKQCDAVTDEAVRKLADALPKCRMVREQATFGPKISPPALLRAPFTKAQADEARKDWAKYEEVPERKQLELPKGVKLELALIPPGQFRMGTEGNPKEQVAHDVTITRPFFMAVTETTQEQYEAVIGKNPSFFTTKGIGKGKLAPGTDSSKFPVEGVSWFDAEGFSKAIGAQLPTEAQWEYACRAGTTTNFHFGQAIKATDANFADAGLERPNRVASYQANAFGLFDMHGNVQEWCRDWYAEKTDDLGERDPERTSKQAESRRVMRGGAWNSNAFNWRSAQRWLGSAPDVRNGSYGFRVVMLVLP
jgi:eukaryotic-like serine/threonine-protein kinase